MMTTEPYVEFKRELAALLNRHSIEADSNTPDSVLAEYLTSCLEVWRQCVPLRDSWHGFDPRKAFEVKESS
jgi:hypothetical protein